MIRGSYHPLERAPTSLLLSPLVFLPVISLTRTITTRPYFARKLRFNPIDRTWKIFIRLSRDRSSTFVLIHTRARSNLVRKRNTVPIKITSRRVNIGSIGWKLSCTITLHHRIFRIRAIDVYTIAFSLCVSFPAISILHPYRASVRCWQINTRKEQSLIPKNPPGLLERGAHKYLKGSIG